MSRIGGVFPFPQQAPANGDGVICLPSGGIYMIPAGEYVALPGDQTNVQWFDPNLEQWRGLNDDTANLQIISSDGTNYRLINLSGVVIGAAITAAGTGGTNGMGFTATGVAVTFAAPASGQTATGYAIVGGSVQAPTIVQGGSGFLVPPYIAIDAPPPGGIQATAYATISAAGVVTAVTMDQVGAGYTASPNFYVLPQPPFYQGAPVAGANANAFPPPGLVSPSNLPAGSLYQPNISTSLGCLLTSNALTGSGTLTGIGMYNNGGGYTGTTIPAVTITGTLTGTTATAIMSMCLTSVTLGSAGVGYGSGAAPLWMTSLGVVAGTFGNQQTSPRVAQGTTTLSAGGVSTFAIEDEGFGFQKVPQVVLLSASSIPTGLATGTAVCGGVVDTSVLQSRVA